MSENADVMPYAGFGKRLYACLIDQSIIQSTALALAYPIGRYMWGDRGVSLESLFEFVAQMMPIVTMLQIIIALGYGGLLESSASGATWGKRYCGLRVTMEDGARLSLMNAFLRNVGINLVFMALCFDFLIAVLVSIIYFTPLIWDKRQTVYDRMLKVVVITTEKQ